jgi:hypothetical protein
MARKAHPPADVESNEQRAPLPDVRIETRRISTLRNAPYNPRRISDSALRGLQSSVERFGLVQPIIVNERTGYIVGGHQRVKALKATGATDALVVLVDLPDTEERALNLALNSPAISGEFTEGLGALLDEVQAADADLFEALMSASRTARVVRARIARCRRKVGASHHTSTAPSRRVPQRARCSGAVEVGRRLTTSRCSACRGHRLEPDA